MRRPSTVTAILLASFLATGVASAQDFDTAGEQQMLARINAMRAAQNLAPLTRNEGLDAAARTHSADMASQGVLTHVSDRTGTPADRIRAAGVTASTIAENVALHRTTEEAHEALLASDAHRANMMSPDVTHIGLAALRTERGVYVTQLFAAIPAAPAPVPELPPPAVVAAPAPSRDDDASGDVEVQPQEVEVPREEEEAPAVAAPEAQPESTGDHCISPVPGIRFCSRASAPAAQRTEPRVEPLAPSAPPMMVPAPAPERASPPANLQVQPGSNGTVIIQRTPDGSRIEGYWVYSGRWWYYPMVAGAQPGQRLQPDLSVSGPPPGFPEHPFGPPRAQATMPPAQPQAWRVAPPPPPVAAPLVPPPRGPARIVVAPGTAFYAVPPPPMMGNPDRNWRRAHAEWMRAYRRWLREQARLRRQAL